AAARRRARSPAVPLRAAGPRRPRRGDGRAGPHARDRPRHRHHPLPRHRDHRLAPRREETLRVTGRRHPRRPAWRRPAALEGRLMAMRLIPARRDIGWTPYLWTIYLVFFLVWPYMRGDASAREWVATAAGAIAFLALYFRGYWVRG